jgi:hypothetical protein
MQSKLAHPLSLFFLDRMLVTKNQHFDTVQSFQFVMKEAGNYSNLLKDADAMVNWEDVVQVVSSHLISSLIIFVSEL